MRVLILSQYYWPESFRITEVADSLADEGCEVTVLTGHPSYPPGKVYKGVRWWRFAWDTHPNGHRILRVPLVPRSPKGGALNLILNYLSFVICGTLAGLWWGRSEKWNVILVYAISPILQSLPGIAIRQVHGAALVTWVQDLWPDSLRATGYIKSSIALRALKRLVSYIYRKNDLLLAQSREFVPMIRTLAQKTEILYHPNPGEKALEKAFSPGSGVSPESVIPFEESAFNIVFAGNLGKLQGLDVLVEAAMLTRNVTHLRWVFIGDGSEKRWLSRTIEERGLSNVVIHDSVSPSDMPGIFAASQALLVSLIDDLAISRTIPSKVQAYLAVGRPIIGALSGEAATVIKEAGAGLIGPAGDATTLAQNARRLAAGCTNQHTAFAQAGQNYYRTHFASGPLTTALIEHLKWAIEIRRGHVRHQNFFKKK